MNFLNEMKVWNAINPCRAMCDWKLMFRTKQENTKFQMISQQKRLANLLL